MRIVLAGSSFISHGRGIASYNRELCDALSEQGHKLLVVTPEQVTLKTWEENHNQNISLYTAIVPKLVRDEVEVARKMFDRIVAYDPHVLISSDNIYLTSLFPCFSDHRLRITISHYYNGILPKTAACRPRETDWIIAISEAGREYLLGLPGCCSEQVVVIYNAVQDCKISVSDLIRGKSRDDILRIVYPGGDSRAKSSDIVLKMVKQLDKSDLNWELVWLGSTNRSRRSLSKNVRKKIVFTGPVPRSEAEEYIRKSHCFVLPSRNEGCPMSLLEAMRTGTIPLVSDCPSAMRELVVHAISGYIVHGGNSQALVSHLLDIGKSHQLRESLMKEARFVYERKLTTDIWTDRMMNLMSRRRPGRSKLLATDQFDSKMVFRWHRRPGKWYCPTIRYLRLKLGYPDLSPLVKI